MIVAILLLKIEGKESSDLKSW